MFNIGIILKAAKEKKLCKICDKKVIKPCGTKKIAKNCGNNNKNN